MRLVTRADFDGLICGVLLSQVEDIDTVELVHPKDIHDQNVSITDDDIIANLPYHPQTAMWFDHHSSEAGIAGETDFRGCFDVAPSCASVIYEYYSCFDTLKKYEPIVIEADKIDSARFNMEDIRNPKKWVLVSNTLNIFDKEKRFEDKAVYFNRLMNMVSYGTLKDILADGEVRDRVHFLEEEQSRYVETLSRCSRADENVIITDVRDLDYVPNGDKFLVYTLFPEQNVSLNVFNKRKTDLTVISGGYSIFNRTCEAHIGELMQQYGGGGHRAAGSCRIKKDASERVLSEIVERLKTGVN